jgi:hypothetical protein
MRWEVLEHPAYSPDVFPCNFHIFGPLNQELKGRRFQSDAQVKQDFRDFFQQRHSEFFEKDIQRLVT